MTQLTATFTVTIKTKPDGDYYFDHDDLVRNVVPWIEGGLDDRDDIAEVTITEQATEEAHAELRHARAALARIRQMADYWEQHLPEVIRTPAVVSALRAAMERAESAAVSAAVAPPTDQTAPLSETERRLRTENERLRNELEVMYGGAFDNLDTPPADRAALRDRIAETLALRENGPASDGRGWFRDEEQRQSFLTDADAVLAVLYREWPWLRAEAEDAAPPADQTALRDRIAEALMQWAEGNNSPKYTSMRRPETVVQNAYSRADAVLAVLPSAGCLTPEYTDGPCHCPSCDPAAHRTDRAAVYAEVAERLAADAEQGDKEGLTRIYRRSAAKQVREWADELLRMAGETATETPAAVLTESERKMLAYALDQAQEHIWSRDGFTDEDQAAVDSLRRLTTDEPAAGARQDGAES